MFKFTITLARIGVSLLALQLASTNEPAKPAVEEPATYEEALTLTEKTAGFKNLQRIGLAFHNYHDIFGKFPPAILFGPDGKTPYSWRVELLPILKDLDGEIDPNKLSDKTSRQQYNELITACGYDMSQSWDSPKNRPVLDAIPHVYRHPSDKRDSLSAGFYAVVGTGTAFDPNDEARREKRIEGDPEAFDPNVEKARHAGINGWTATTLMIVESRSGEPWTKPIDIAYSKSATVPRFGGFTRNGFLALSCDGAVHFVSDTVSPDSLRAFISKETTDTFSIIGVPYQYK